MKKMYLLWDESQLSVASNTWRVFIIFPPFDTLGNAWLVMSVKKSPKIQKLVVNAIRKLQDVQGSTPQEISNYISQEYDVPNTKIQRQVRLALARAVSYGILQRSKG